MRRSDLAVRPAPFVVGLLAFVGGSVGSFALDDPRLRFPAHLAASLIAVAGGLGVVRAGPGPVGLRWAVAAGLGLRLWALFLPPAFSEDVFRYVYEGRLIGWGGPLFPFLHPPADGPRAGVPEALLDEAWLRINHAELATVYPPFAQAVFALAALLGDALGGRHLVALKGCLLLADLGTWRLLHRRSPVDALVWGLSPLVVQAVAREGHADVLSTLGLALALVAFERGSAPAGYAGLAAAGAAKLNGFLLAPIALRFDRRGAWVLLPALAVVLVPYVLAAGGDRSGLAAYASRWQAGDGAFQVLLAAAGALLGGDWVHLRVAAAGIGLTLTRHQLARGFALLAILGALVMLLTRRSGPRDGRGLAGDAPRVGLAERGGVLLVLVLLLAPTLHPWYVLWVLPFAAVGPTSARGAILWLAGAALLLDHPGWLELVEGRWRELDGVRVLVHLPAWGLLLAGALRPGRGPTP